MRKIGSSGLGREFEPVLPAFRAAGQTVDRYLRRASFRADQIMRNEQRPHSQKRLG